jgi:hypothetical protein
MRVDAIPSINESGCRQYQTECVSCVQFGSPAFPARYHGLCPCSYATLIDTSRRLVLRRPDSVVLSCGLDTELHYRNEILRESAQDIQDARAAARAYIAQLNAGETVKLPGRRRPGIQETHPLSFILRDVLIPAVSTERISVAAAKYEVQVPNIDRNKRFYGEFDAIVRAFEKK